MAAFLLVHGAWHDERCWDLVVPELTAHGHGVHTLTLPGHWDRRISSHRVSLKRYANAVCDAAEQIREPLVLVGHSMGGMVISKAAEMRPDLFNHMIYLTAYVPQLDKWTRMRRLTLDDKETHLWPALRTNWLKFSVEIHPDHAVDLFYHDCTPDIARLATSRLSAQSGRPIVEFMRATEKCVGSVPKTYIECLKDKVISLACQRRMQTYMPFERVLSLDTSHSPFLSQPGRLAETMHQAVALPRTKIEEIRPGLPRLDERTSRPSEALAGVL